MYTETDYINLTADSTYQKEQQNEYTHLSDINHLPGMAYFMILKSYTNWYY